LTILEEIQMTIKQLGGVFGRNPTFNDVTIEGELTFDGDIDVNSDLKVDGDLEVTGTIAVGNSSAAAMIDVRTDAGEYALRLENGSGYYFRVADGGLTEVGGNVKLTTAGSGIDFSATSGTGTSELFDDYEEGTWTPTLVGSTSAGTATFVSGPTGIYTKIGNQVTVYFDWNISAHTGTGALRVNGLPFAKGAGVAVGTIMDGNYTYSAGRTRLVPYVVGSVLRFYGVGDGVGYLENALDTSHQINGSVTYTV
jgi:hypothetical protein